MDNVDPRIRSEAHLVFDKTKKRLYGQILVDITVEQKTSIENYWTNIGKQIHKISVQRIMP